MPPEITRRYIEAIEKQKHGHTKHPSLMCMILSKAEGILAGHWINITVVMGEKILQNMTQMKERGGMKTFEMGYIIVTICTN